MKRAASLHELLSWLILLLALSVSPAAWAKLRVVATTTDLGALATAVGGERIELETIARGTQDPHFIETKPSFMVKIARADLIVANGLSLEEGWLPSLVRGSRNPNVRPGTLGYLDLGSSIDPIDVPKGEVTRAQGDVHPAGNPHFTVDPIRLGIAATALATRLGELDAANKGFYLERAAGFDTEMKSKTAAWQARLDKLAVKNVVTYHATLNYFLTRFGLKAVAALEPKPGVPPSAQHVLDVIATMKRENVKAVLVDSWFDARIGERVVQDVPGARVATVAVAVGAKPGVDTNAEVIEQLVAAIEGANSAASKSPAGAK